MKEKKKSGLLDCKDVYGFKCLFLVRGWFSAGLSGSQDFHSKEAITSQIVS